jgi:DNA replication protein DnaC
LQEKLTISRLDGTYQKLAIKLKTYDLLIIDDFGLSPIGMINSREILDILDDRLNFKSTLIASQIPPQDWHSIIEDQTTADAIIDRLIHDSINLNLTGESYRKLKALEKSKENSNLEN